MRYVDVDGDRQVPVMRKEGDDVENQSGESLVSEGDVTWAKLCGIPSRYATAPHHQRRTSVISQAGVLPGAAPTSPFQPKPPDLTCQHHHHHQHHTHNHRHHQNIYKEKQKIQRRGSYTSPRRFFEAMFCGAVHEKCRKCLKKRR